MIALSKCGLFTYYSTNCLSQHHQGKHCRRGGIGEESRAEDWELLPAGRGASHWEGRHAFFSAVIKHATGAAGTQTCISYKNAQRDACKLKWYVASDKSDPYQWSRWGLARNARKICKCPHRFRLFPYQRKIISLLREPHLYWWRDVWCCLWTWIFIFVYLKSASALNVFKLPKDLEQLCSFCLFFWADKKKLYAQRANWSKCFGFFFLLSDFCCQSGRASSPPAVGWCCQAWCGGGRGEGAWVLTCFFFFCFFLWSSPTFPFTPITDWHPRLISIFSVQHCSKDHIKLTLLPVGMWLMQFLLWLKISWWQWRLVTCINEFKCAVSKWWIIILQFISLFDFSKFQRVLALTAVVVHSSNAIVSKDNIRRISTHSDQIMRPGCYKQAQEPSDSQGIWGGTLPHWALPFQCKPRFQRVVYKGWQPGFMELSEFQLRRFVHQGWIVFS